MAYCEMHCIHAGSKHLGHALEYAVALKKTAIDREDAQAGGQPFASGIGIVSPETALQDFRRTWRLFGKDNQGRAAYHLIQSFSPEDKLSADTAHMIGREMAEQLFPGHQAVIGTHLDRNHIHNHIVINAVSAIDGRKVHFKKSFLDQQVRTLSDDLCRQNGLSVIDRSPAGQGSKRGSWRQTAKNDLEYALARSEGNRTLAMGMVRRFGYEVETDAKGIRIRPEQARRFLRFGWNDLTPPGKGNRCKGPLRALRGTPGFRRRSVRLTPFEARTLEYAAILSRQRTCRNPDIAAEQYQAAPAALDALRLIVRGGMRSEADVARARKRLLDERLQLKRRRRQLKAVLDGETDADRQEIHTELAGLGRRLDDLKGELDMLKRIEDSKPVAQTVIQAEDKKRSLAKWQRGRAELPHMNSEDGIEEAEERRKQNERSGTGRRQRGGWDR